MTCIVVNEVKRTLVSRANNLGRLLSCCGIIVGHANNVGTSIVLFYFLGVLSIISSILLIPELQAKVIRTKHLATWQEHYLKDNSELCCSYNTMKTGGNITILILGDCKLA